MTALTGLQSVLFPLRGIQARLFPSLRILRHKMTDVIMKNAH